MTDRRRRASARRARADAGQAGEHARLPADAGAGGAHAGRRDARGAQAGPVGHRVDALGVDVQLVHDLPAEARGPVRRAGSAEPDSRACRTSTAAIPEFGAALVDAWKEAGVAAVRTRRRTTLGLRYVRAAATISIPTAEVPVVGIPVVLMADHGECLRAGAAVHAMAKKLGRRVVFVCSSALSHLLVRGRHNWPTPERVEADKRFVEQLKRGAIDEAIAGFTEYSKKVVAEMGGRALATMLGVGERRCRATASTMLAQQYGEYAQSSGSNNAVLADRRPGNARPRCEGHVSKQTQPRAARDRQGPRQARGNRMSERARRSRARPEGRVRERLSAADNGGQT